MVRRCPFWQSLAVAMLFLLVPSASSQTTGKLISYQARSLINQGALVGSASALSTPKLDPSPHRATFPLTNIATPAYALAWGSNNSGQLGNGTQNASASPGLVSTSHSMALRSDGSVWVWGDNNSGQLATTGIVSSSVPLHVSGLSAVTSIAAGYNHSAVLTNDGNVWSWGSVYSYYYNPCNGLCYSAINIYSSGDATAIVAGNQYTLVLKSNGTAQAWGGGNVAYNSNLSGEQGILSLGSGPTAFHALIIAAPQISIAPPSQLTFGLQVPGVTGSEEDLTISTTGTVPLRISSVSITGAAASDYAITLDICTGAQLLTNNSCALGVTFTAITLGPRNATLIINDNTPGSPHLIALSGIGALATPTNTATATSTPTPSTTPSSTATPSATPTNTPYVPTVSLVNTATPAYAVVWGNNQYGQLGTGDRSSLNNPTPLNALGNKVLSLAVGQDHSLALTTDGSVWAWGYNSSGQLGVGNQLDSLVPEKIPALSQIVAIAAGGTDSLALSSDGHVWAWGDDSFGQLGISSTVSMSVPVEIQELSNVIAVAAGGDHNLALRSDGTVWAWGLDDQGQLGAATSQICNSYNCVTTPTRISGFTSVTAIAAGGEFSMALRADGSVWAWGSNSSDQLANSILASSSVPLKVGGLSSVKAIAAGYNHSLALTTDGNVWGWGNSPGYYFGNTPCGAYSNYYGSCSTPTMFYGGQDALAVAAGQDYSLILTKSATAYATSDGYFSFRQNSTGEQGVVSLATGASATSAMMVVEPLFSSAPLSRVDFGNQLSGTTSTEQDVTVSTTGTIPLNVSNVSITGVGASDFAVTLDLCTGAQVLTNGSCTIGVTFTPDGLGQRTATLVINDNTPNSPHLITLTGNGALPTPTSTSTSTNSPTSTFTSTPTATATRTPTSTLTPTQTSTATDTPSPTSTSTPAPTNTPTRTATSTQTPLPTNTPTNSATPTSSSTSTATALPTRTSTATTVVIVVLPATSTPIPPTAISTATVTASPVTISQPTPTATTFPAVQVQPTNTIAAEISTAKNTPMPTVAALVSPVAAKPTASLNKRQPSRPTLHLSGSLRVVGGQILSLQVDSLPRAQIKLTIQVTTVHSVTVGKGKKQHRVNQTVVLYRLFNAGNADHHGHYVAHLHIQYHPTKATGGSLAIVATAGKTVARQNVTLTILPAHHS